MISTPAYISKVYATLSLGIVCTAIGAYFTSIPCYLPLVVSIPFMIDCAWNECQTQQVTSFLIASFCHGVLLADTVNTVGTDVALTALSTTFVIFLSISFAAYLAKDTSTLVSYSLLASVTSILACVSIFNMFVQSEVLLLADLLIGIVCFSGYIFLDTIKMVFLYEESGNETLGVDAMGLYLDGINLFVRLLILLGKLKDEKKKRT